MWQTTGEESCLELEREHGGHENLLLLWHTQVLIANTHMSVHIYNSSSREPSVLSGFHVEQVQTWCTGMHAGKTATYIK